MRRRSQRVLARGTNDIEAWQFCVRAAELYIRFNPTDYLEARVLAERAVERDPNYAYAWATLGLIYWWDSRLGYTGETEAKLIRANEYAERAMALDDTLSWVIGLNVHVAVSQGREQDALAIALRGVEFNPGNADIRAFLALSLTHTEKYRESIRHLNAAMSLNPFYPNWYRYSLTRNLMILGEFEEALVILDEVLSVEPANLGSWVCKAYMFGEIGRTGEAEAAIREVGQLAPNLRLTHVPKFLVIKEATATQRIVDGLRKVGFPE